MLTTTTSSGSGAMVTLVVGPPVAAAACEAGGGASGCRFLLGGMLAPFFGVESNDAPGSAGSVDICRSDANTFFVGVGFGVVAAVCLVTVVVVDCNVEGKVSREGLTKPSNGSVGPEEDVFFFSAARSFSLTTT